MPQADAHLQEVLLFIREHRSNEANFAQLLNKLDEEINNATSNPDYHAALREAKEQHATTYTEARNQGGTAWPEFEKFVTQFERSVAAALK